MSFVHLHNHTHYSILQGLPKPKDYVAKAKEFGMKAVAITDTSNIHGWHELYEQCVSAGITPILGTEIFVESSLDPNLNHKLVLLAKNLKWYQNIIALTSRASLDNAGMIPKVTLDDVKQFSEHTVALSGPITGEIPYYILCGKSDEQILAKIKEYQEIFWEENYFLELLYHQDIPKQNTVTDKLIEINKNYGIPVVAANNNYYIEKSDAKTQDVIQALGTGHELENPDRATLINGDYSFLSEEEMQWLFGFLPEALSNTQKIADMVDMQIETGWILIPTFELPQKDQIIYEKALEIEEKNEEYTLWGFADLENKTRGLNVKKLDSSEWYLRYLSFKWLNWRYDYGLSEDEIFMLIQKLDKPSLDKKLTETSPEELKELSLIYYSDKKKQFLETLEQKQQDYIERLEYELVVIHEMGFDAYFLIVADYINWARDNDIPVWPGRWSAAGSIMAFLSGITDIDPMEYDLLFERFLNPARVSMPDIDTDFADNERDRVVEYCRNKYGSDKVAQICTFGTFAARAAVKDVWRVMWIWFAEMNGLAKLIPEKPGTKLKWALEDSFEFNEAYNTNPVYKEIIDNALKIEWNVRQLWVHACAVIIAPEPMTTFTALQHPPKDVNAIITQYSANPLEDLGLLKMDFLWLRNLTIIKRAQKIIKNNKWVDIDILKIDLKDQKVFDVFAAGDTTWVFQFESDGMRKYLKDLKPNVFEDLIAMVSLYRPGPLAYIPTFIDRKYGREEIKYMTDALINIMQEAGYSDEIIEEQKDKLENDLKSILDVSYGIAVYQEQLMFIVQYMAWFSLGEADLLRRWVGKKKVEVVEALKKQFIERGASYKWYKPEVSRYIYEEMIQPAANYSFNKSHAACYAYIAYQTAYLKAYYEAEFLNSIMVSDEENMERIVLVVWECQSKWINVLPPSVQESMKHFTYIDDNNIRFGLKAIKGIWDGPINKVIATRDELWRNFENLEEFIESCGNEVINKKSLEALIMSGSMDTLWDRAAMFKSIPEMIKFCRKDEKKRATSQIWLFDDSDVFEEKLELIQTDPFTFEELLAGEKEMIWFSVSGHALDGLGRYCMRRSNNVKKLKIPISELLEADKKENPDNYLPDAEKKKLEEENKKNWIKKERPKDEIVQAVWVVADVRKIVTKTGKPMVFLKCEWFDFDFEVVIFPKDVEKYQDKLEVDKIVIVNWGLQINFEYGRKTIQARDIKIASISQVREQATDLWLMNKQKRLLFNPLAAQQEESVEEKKSESDNQENSQAEDKKFDENLDKKIHTNESEPQEQISQNTDKYVVEIPSHAKKEDLHELKSFLLELQPGEVQVFILLKWQEIFTKISVSDIQSITDWEQDMWY